MQESKKQRVYYISIFLISFFLGLFFDHYILHKSLDSGLKVKEDLEIVLESETEQLNKDKTTSIESGCAIYVDASGALKNPGVYCLDSGTLIIDAINKAGGFSKEAAMKFIYRKINLAQPLINNQKLYFPFENELICQIEPLVEESKKIEAMYTNPVTTLPTTEPYSEQNSTPATTQSPTNTTNNNSPQCVNINTATKEQLVTLNGVGEVTAEKIIQGRPYSKVEDLLNVSGIGEATLNKFKDNVCI
jgi:competence protein ComEA